MKLETTWLLALKLALFLTFLTNTHLNAQATYSGKFEIGYLPYIGRTGMVKPGPDWKGYDLNEKQSGIEINMVHGIRGRKEFFIGAGVGYLNYQGIQGYSLFGEIVVTPIRKKRTSPLFGLKIGGAHIYNQYEKGSKSSIVELNFGFNHKATAKLDLYVKTGIRFAHMAMFTPLRIGVGF